MSKKAFMAAIAILALLVSSAMAAGVQTRIAAANPVGFYIPRSPPPSPVVEAIELDTDKLTLTFSVQKTGTWITPYGSKLFGDYEPNHEWNYSVSSMVWVDGKLWDARAGQDWVAGPISVSLGGLSCGGHILKIIAVADGEGMSWPNSQWVSDEIKFIVDDPSPTQTTIPTATPTPTPSISPSPSPSSTPLEPVFSMPKEYLNYTIAERNGAPWAIIDGIYPIFYSNQDIFDIISMVYPTPPGTTNITITVNGTNIGWSNFTEQFPTALHHTMLGEWAMVEATFQPSAFFTLAIHYEHPIIQVNGTYQFLYDLNIGSYLSDSSPNSTAYFRVKTEMPLSTLKIYAVPNDNDRNELSYATHFDGARREVTFEVTSEFDKPLLGDVLFTFSNDEAVQNSVPITWIVIPIIIMVVSATGALIFLKRRKTANE